MKLTSLGKVLFTVSIIILISMATTYFSVIKINKSPANKQIQKGAIGQIQTLINETKSVEEGISRLKKQIPYYIICLDQCSKDGIYRFLEANLENLKKLPIPERWSLFISDSFNVDWILELVEIDYRRPWSEIEKYLLGE